MHSQTDHRAPLAHVCGTLTHQRPSATKCLRTVRVRILRQAADPSRGGLARARQCRTTRAAVTVTTRAAEHETALAETRTRVERGPGPR